MILGLDISTSTVGFTLMNLTGGVEYIGYTKPTGDNQFEKVESAFNCISKVVQSHVISNGPITSIYAEAPNIMFRTGFSSAQTLAIILRFNGALLFTLYRHFGILPKEAMAVSMRKQVIGIGRFKVNPKDEILRWVNLQIPTTNWPQIAKGKNKGKLSTECYDMADSYIVARYGLIHERGDSTDKN